MVECILLPLLPVAPDEHALHLALWALTMHVLLDPQPRTAPYMRAIAEVLQDPVYKHNGITRLGIRVRKPVAPRVTFTSSLWPMEVVSCTIGSGANGGAHGSSHPESGVIGQVMAEMANSLDRHPWMRPATSRLGGGRIIMCDI